MPSADVRRPFYDSFGRYSASVDALGFRTTSVYDGLDRAIATIDALGNRSTTVYDADDRVASFIDARGKSLDRGVRRSRPAHRQHRCLGPADDQQL